MRVRRGCRSMILAPWLPSGFDPLRANIVRTALGLIQIVERPRGSNRSGLIDQMCTAVGSPVGSSWCACFAWWVYRLNGAKVPPENAGSVASSVLWAKAEGWWKEKVPPEMGDIIVFQAINVPDHCGIVTNITEDGMWTIEGNTNGNQSREGDGVYSHQRLGASDILGYIVPSPVSQ